MRRQYSGRADSMVKSAEGEQGFWPSYADMMSAVALILFFLMLLSYIQNLITGNNLQNTQELLDDTKTRLASTELELKDTEDSLALTLKQVEDAETELSKITIDLDRVKLTLAEKEHDLAAQDQLLSNQSALLQEQEEYMKAASQEILELRGQMQTIAVLRLSILEQIRDSVVKVMGDASKVSIGENGNIVLSEGVFFDVGSSAIKAGAIPTLNQLIDVFQRFLSDPNNVKYVDSVVISGHTDSTGTDENNRVLSTDRANAVLGYLLDNGGGKLQQYASYFCAAGYGETRPVADNETEEGRAQNRRIEISIILKDDSVLDIVESYLDIEVPESVQNRAGAARSGS
ncbi:MAG: OmpA family protein [Oscillospiraceae bacterium]|nr:OmpA family protein [Oscillospiraceae bacterium]